MGYFKGQERGEAYNDNRTSGLYQDAHPDIGCGGDCTHSLECPYPICILDDPGVLTRQQRQTRNTDILRLYHEGNPPSRIAEEMGISPRAVYRALSSYRQKESTKR